MKKRILAGTLALALLAGVVTLAGASSQSQALVSRSYLGGGFWDDLKAIVFSETEKNTTAIYNEAAAKARQIVDGVASGGAGSGSFAVKAGINGDVLTAAVGSGLIWTAGTGVVRDGTLVDATEGREVASGGALAVGHRYLAGTDVSLVVTSSSAQWMGEGEWAVTAGEAVLPFPDVPLGQWYYDDVAYVYQKGLFGSTGSGYFEPYSMMQRCMMTTVLYRLAGKPPVSYTPMFRDVPDGQWYTSGTIWAGQLKVVTGKGDSQFDLFSNVTRQEIAVILYRYAEKMGYDVSQTADLSGFSDNASVASWSRQAVSWAVSVGILKGSGGALRPTGDATRAEVAAMFHRFDNWTG
ncbi:MAG: S-layer homology domain-containing protein [Clostridiales bacterium]|nr:S-layer homology domain-containing protein [Clostridiales bacterium]